MCSITARRPLKTGRLVAIRIGLAIWIAAAIVFAWTPAGAQERPAARPLTYPQAVALARERNAELAAAHADARRVEGEALQVSRGLLPTVRLEEGYVRSDDPSTVFGMKLKQGRFTPQDLSPDRLADPDAFGGYTTVVTVGQPLVNLDAWQARRQANNGVRAAHLSTARAEQELDLEVLRAYYALPLAVARIDAIREGLAAAEDAVRQAEALERQGLVSRVDVLQAQVRAAEVRAELADATAMQATAEAGLRRVLGSPAAESVVAADPVPVDSTVPRLSEALRDGGERLDVRARNATVDAAAAGVGREPAARLPRLNAFGTYERNDDDAFGGRGNWSAGISLAWTPFDGLQQVGRVRAAVAALDRETAQRTALRQQVEFEIQTAHARLEAARLRRDHAEQAMALAREAHAIAATRYRNSLAPITDLLAAGAAETAAATRLAAARYDIVVAAGAYRVAAGLSPREE